MQEIIVSDEKTRGNGKSKFSPIRRITRVLTKDGVEIAEFDPCSATVESIYDFMRYHFNKIPKEEVEEKLYAYFLQEDNEELQKFYVKTN